MNITEVRVKLADAHLEKRSRILAYCLVLIDDAFLVRDIKIIHVDGRFLVAMPSRQLHDRCPRCRQKNSLQASFCHHCGVALSPDRAPRDTGDRPRLYADVAHPVNAESRSYVERVILAAYLREVELSKDPDYSARWLDFDDIGNC